MPAACFKRRAPPCKRFDSMSAAAVPRTCRPPRSGASARVHRERGGIRPRRADLRRQPDQEEEHRADAGKETMPKRNPKTRAPAPGEA